MNNIRAVMLAILALVIVGGTACDTTVMLSDPSTDWPGVKPISLNVHVTSKNPKVVLDVYSDRESSNPLYQLRCNAGDAEDRLEKEDYYYSMFQCHLIDMNNKPLNLLMGTESWVIKDYHTRAIFTYEQLMGPCKDNPFYGFRREFKVRGMNVVLAISKFESPSMADMLSERVTPRFSFDFQVDITPNPSAVGGLPEPAPGNYCGGYYELNSRGEAIYHEYRW